MPENNFLHRKREIEFQRRVLASLQDTKANKTWKFINSPFVLWFLSVIIIGLVSLYFTNYRGCIQQAASRTDSYVALIRELRSRMVHVRAIVWNSNTVAEIQDGLSSPYYVNSDFKDATIEELRHRLERLKMFINWTNGDPDAADMEAVHLTEMEDNRFWRILYGYLEPDMKDDEIPLLRQAIDKYVPERRHVELIKMQNNCIYPYSLFKFMSSADTRTISGAITTRSQR